MEICEILIWQQFDHFDLDSSRTSHQHVSLVRIWFDHTGIVFVNTQKFFILFQSFIHLYLNSTVGTSKLYLFKQVPTRKYIKTLKFFEDGQKHNLLQKTVSFAHHRSNPQPDGVLFSSLVYILLPACKLYARFTPRFPSLLYFMAECRPYLVTTMLWVSFSVVMRTKTVL